MRSLRIGASAAVLSSVVWAPAVAMAQQSHSFCVPGRPMVNPSPAGTDSTTSQVVANVCSKTAFASCCNQSGGRWSMACVQQGADFARQSNLSGGDVCGRYAWTQGPIAGTQQFYPRDFNLFTLAGDASTFRDVQGAVAIQGNASTSGFNLDWTQQERIGLVANGSVTLANGTLFGNSAFGTTFTASGVTFVGGSRPTAPSHPIDFAGAATKLQAMSTALTLYTSTPATKTNSTVTFRGTDPELNVFTVSTSLFAGTTEYTFDVPAGSAAIVNVSGATPNIQNAGIDMVSGSPSNNKILWNFIDATSLTLQSVMFPGSILAPNAAAHLINGKVSGTVVVKSALQTTAELYRFPLVMGGCTGCLCMDTTWSCSDDTSMDDRGRATDINYEAGFLEIPGGAYVAENLNRTSPKHRVWYSFQPAAVTPKTKPLAVFFNGGPGAATTAFLFAFNTGHWTFDPQVTGPGGGLSSNPANWQQLANLLYIDAPGTGFSYPLPLDDGTKPSVGIDIDRDSGIFLRIITRFLARHPTLQKNPVLIVGESYGGTRATLMLSYLYNYQTLVNSTAPYRDTALHDELLAYFSAVFGTQSPTTAQIGQTFNHQVLIDPAVEGNIQLGHNTGQDRSVCLAANFDPYNCDQPTNFSPGLEATAGANIVKLATLNVALQANPRTIAWFQASARTNAYGRSNGTIISAPEFTAAFGTLGASDTYLISQNSDVQVGYLDANGRSRDWFSAGLAIGNNFLANVTNVTSFITYGLFDTVIWGPAIAVAAGDGSFSNLIATSAIDQVPRTGIVRPGWIELGYQSGAKKEIRFPTYSSGHTVSMRQPSQLLADVTQWYTATTTPSSGSALTAEPPAVSQAQVPVPARPFTTAPGPFLGP
jgi:choice-of-anchor A domain-containing protein